MLPNLVDRDVPERDRPTNRARRRVVSAERDVDERMLCCCGTKRIVRSLLQVVVVVAVAVLAAAPSPLPSPSALLFRDRQRNRHRLVTLADCVDCVDCVEDWNEDCPPLP